jgi:hypothetical protein
VVGLQWQFSPTAPEADGGADAGAIVAADGGGEADAGPADGGADAASVACPVDVTVTGIKFLP